MVLKTCTFITKNDITVVYQNIKKIYEKNISIRKCVINRFMSNLVVSLDLDMSLENSVTNIVMDNQMIRENIIEEESNYKIYKLSFKYPNEPENIFKLLNIINNNGYQIESLEIYFSFVLELNMIIKVFDNTSIESINDIFENL